MGQVTKVLNISGPAGLAGLLISQLINPQQKSDEVGAVQTKVTPNASTFTILVQGRLSTEGDGDTTGCPWITLDTIDNTDVLTAGSALTQNLNVLPYMRFKPTAVQGNVTALECWFME